MTYVTKVCNVANVVYKICSENLFSVLAHVLSLIPAKRQRNVEQSLWTLWIKKFSNGTFFSYIKILELMHVFSRISFITDENILPNVWSYGSTTTLALYSVFIIGHHRRRCHRMLLYEYCTQWQVFSLLFPH